MSEGLKMRRPAVDLDDFERNLFASAPTDRAESDPLAELSRIVGKTDPFKGLFSSQAPTVKSGSREPDFKGMMGGFSAQGIKAAPFAEAPPVAFAAPQQLVAANSDVRTPQPDPFSPRYFDEANPTPSDADAEAEFYAHLAPVKAEDMDPDYTEAYEAAMTPDVRSRSLRGTASLVAVLLIAMVGAGAALGWRGQLKQASDGTVPIVKAVATPIKVEPAKSEAASADAAPAQDANAKLISKAEQPVEIVQTPGQPPIKIARIIPLSGDQTSAIMTGTGAPQVTPPSESGLPVPRSVKTVTIDASGKPIGGAASAPAKPLSAASAPVTQPQAAPTSIAQLAAQSDPIPIPAAAPRLPLMAAGGAPSRTPAPVTVAPTDTAPVAPRATTPKATTRAAAPAPKPVVAAAKPQTADAPLQLSPTLAQKPAKLAAKPVQTAAVDSAATDNAQTGETKTAANTGTFAVQLAAPATEAEAKATAARLQGQYATELNGHKTVVRKADLGPGRVVYRVRVANLSKDDAVSICESLKASGGQCFISR